MCDERQMGQTRPKLRQVMGQKTNKASSHTEDRIKVLTQSDQWAGSSGPVGLFEMMHVDKTALLREAG